jgi:hypothetical protein
MKPTKNDYDVLNEVSALIERKLDVLEALGEAMKYRMVVRSRLVCRCPSCVGETERTLGWLEEMRAPQAPAETPTPAPPAAQQSRISRIFGER